MQAIRRIRREYGATTPALIITVNTAPDSLREVATSGYNLFDKPCLLPNCGPFLSKALSEAIVDVGGG